jgi:hypothetical protein
VRSRDSNNQTPDHKIVITGNQLSLGSQVWKRSCGKWEMAVPTVGSFGHTTSKARITQINMAFGMHVKFAVSKVAA